MQAHVVPDGGLDLSHLGPAFPAGAQMFLYPLGMPLRKLAIRRQKEFFTGWM